MTEGRDFGVDKPDTSVVAIIVTEYRNIDDLSLLPKLQYETLPIYMNKLCLFPIRTKVPGYRLQSS